MNLETNTIARNQWELAVPIIERALRMDWLVERRGFDECQFAEEMLEEWKENGIMFEPTNRQFNLFLHLAREHE